MKRTDLAYTAGIIDGEGWICIKRTPRAYQITVGVGNTNEWLINWLQFSFGGGVYPRTGLADNQKPQWHWNLSTRQAGNFLKLILPYLRIKRPQAELAIQFQSRRRYRGHKPMSDGDKALDEANKILMGSYNKRGK